MLSFSAFKCVKLFCILHKIPFLYVIHFEVVENFLPCFFLVKLFENSNAREMEI